MGDAIVAAMKVAAMTLAILERRIINDRGVETAVADSGTKS